MPNKSKPHFVTIQFKLTESAHAELEKLKTITGSSSYTEVLKDALAFYRWALAQKQKGERIFSIPENQDTVGTEVILPSF